MLNTLSTQVFDVAGYVEIDVTPDTTPGASARRMNRVATLDGGSVVNDGGFTEADRIIELAWVTADSSTLGSAVDRLVQFYTRLQISTSSGVFTVAPEVYTPGVKESKLRLLVLAKLSA